MLSPPSTIREPQRHHLAPGVSQSRRSRSSRFASASTPSRPASVATSAIPASETTLHHRNDASRPGPRVADRHAWLAPTSR
jgi:hypothetical protein